MFEKEFDDAINFVLKWEGGYSFDKDDPGGETKYGISKRAFPNIDIKNLTIEQAKEIYYNNYWKKTKCNLISHKLRLIYFDSCINLGYKRAVKILQQTINSFKIDNLVVDGLLGNKTLAAMDNCNNQELPYRYVLFRIKFYMIIIISKKKSIKYIKGWLKRSFDLIN